MEESPKRKKSKSTSAAAIQSNTSSMSAIEGDLLRKPTRLHAGVELGSGTVADPYAQVVGDRPNQAGCYYCPAASCHCEMFKELLEETWEAVPLKRITSVAGKKHMCAKSIEPNFVARIVRLLNISSQDKFYDLGSGNGSVLFQIAFLTGADCVGVELSTHNADLSRQAWAYLRPRLEKLSGRKMPEVKIVTGDLTQFIADPNFGTGSNTVIWTSNLLMPRPVTAYMAERFRYLAAGSRIACFDDIYPHGRSTAKLFDPSAFVQFKMIDVRWPKGAVEWCNEEGKFYIHIRTDVSVEAADQQAAR
jgi:SAM-dependent methyltransferase